MAWFDMKIHIIEHHVTENMLGILSARVLRGGLEKIAKTVSLYWISVMAALICALAASGWQFRGISDFIIVYYVKFSGFRFAGLLFNG